jgi:hypothetical protein
MAYFIFIKNSDNVENTLYRIAENQFDLNNLNISQTDCKIIEDSQLNFDLVKYGNKFIIKYNNNIITYVDHIISFLDKKMLQKHIDSFKNSIKQFIDNNPGHLLFNRWNNYYNQLNSLDLNTITYPLNMSLEQYFKDQGQESLSTLQLP